MSRLNSSLPLTNERLQQQDIRTRGLRITTLIHQKHGTSKVIRLVHRWHPTSVPRWSADSRPKATSLLAPGRLQIDCARAFARIAASGHRRALPVQLFPSPRSYVSKSFEP
jgi:hypothetical protein